MGAAYQKQVPDNINAKLSQESEVLKNYRTSCLWIQYMERIGIQRKSLKADRTGDWELHLAFVYEMLPYFAASGHNLYAKSPYLYLQMMLQLQATFPDMYQKFFAGCHV